MITVCKCEEDVRGITELKTLEKIILARAHYYLDAGIPIYGFFYENQQLYSFFPEECIDPFIEKYNINIKGYEKIDIEKYIENITLFWTVDLSRKPPVICRQVKTDKKIPPLL